MGLGPGMAVSELPSGMGQTRARIRQRRRMGSTRPSPRAPRDGARGNGLRGEKHKRHASAGLQPGADVPDRAIARPSAEIGPPIPIRCGHVCIMASEMLY